MSNNIKNTIETIYQIAETQNKAKKIKHNKGNSNAK